MTTGAPTNPPVACGVVLSATCTLITLHRMPKEGVQSYRTLGCAARLTTSFMLSRLLGGSLCGSLDPLVDPPVDLKLKIPALANPKFLSAGAMPSGPSMFAQIHLTFPPRGTGALRGRERPRPSTFANPEALCFINQKTLRPAHRYRAVHPPYFRK